MPTSKARAEKTGKDGDERGNTEVKQRDTGEKGDDDDVKLEGENGSGREAEDEDDSPFGQLVLPEGHKKMVKSLVAQHFRDKESQEERQADIISGKGENALVVVDNLGSLQDRKGSNHPLTWRSWSWEDNYSW